MTTQELIDYHEKQLLRIARSLNPDFPLGTGLIATIKAHQNALEQLEKQLEL